MKPKISICCLVYNHANYLSQAIDSFLMQKGDFELEIVVFDDCSTDESRTIVSSYANKHPQLFRLIYPEKNIYSQGKTAYFNLISAATGDFIACCEGDDYWIEPDKLQKQLNVIIKNQDVNLIFHPALTLHTDGSISDEKYGFYGDEITEKSFIEILKCSGGFMPMASIFARKSAYTEWFDNYPDFFSENMWHSVIQILGSYKSKAIYLPEKMSVYRTMHEGSWSLSISKNSDAIVNDYLNYLKRNRKLNEIMGFEFEKAFNRHLKARTAAVLKNKIVTRKQKKHILSFAKSHLNLVGAIKFKFLVFFGF